MQGTIVMTTWSNLGGTFIRRDWSPARSTRLEAVACDALKKEYQGLSWFLATQNRLLIVFKLCYYKIGPIRSWLQTSGVCTVYSIIFVLYRVLKKCATTILFTYHHTIYHKCYCLAVVTSNKHLMENKLMKHYFCCFT